MANYEINLTATQIEAALNKAHSPATTVDNTQNLVESSAIKAYVDGAISPVAAYPIGSIYMNADDSRDPSVIFGFGTWSPFGAGRVPVGIDSTQTEFTPIGKEDGFKTHTLQDTEMPNHSHALGSYGSGSGGGSPTATTGNSNQGTRDTQSAGGGQPHNNLQPYVVVYMWRRTA